MELHEALEVETKLPYCTDEWVSGLLLAVSLPEATRRRYIDEGSIHISDAWWMMFYPILVPILELMPRTWTSPWLQSVSPCLNLVMPY